MIHSYYLKISTSDNVNLSDKYVKNTATLQAWREKWEIGGGGLKIMFTRCPKHRYSKSTLFFLQEFYCCLKSHVPYFPASPAAGHGQRSSSKCKCKCTRDFWESYCFSVKAPTSCLLILPFLTSDRVLERKQLGCIYEGRKIEELVTLTA